MRKVVALLFALLLWAPFAYAQNACQANPAVYSSTAANGHEDSKVIWGTSGALGSGGSTHFCQMAVANNSAATVWAMVFDSATVPANNTLPKFEMPVTAASAASMLTYPWYMATGVSVACSSTEGKLTVTVANSCNFEVTIAR